jgi:hypothetical protein
MRKTTLNDVMNVIAKWTKDHEGNVSFVGGFTAFNKKFEVTDGRMIAFGHVDILKTEMDELEKELKKEKEFVNW